MGRVIRAWRTHPEHGRCPIAQDRVAGWMDITQAQLSRIENGPPLAHLDRLIQWARVLQIPRDLLWFTLPPVQHRPAAGTTTRERAHPDVKRRTFLSTPVLVVAAGVAGAARTDGARDAIEWLAWHLWQTQAGSAHRSAIPSPVVDLLDQDPRVRRDADQNYRFADPGLVEVLVARRIFGDIATGSSQLLATAQTSHTTDLVLSTDTAASDTAQRALRQWTRAGHTAIMRVNAAGVLSKVGDPELSDVVLAALATDQDMRHLYLTAVASRVLNLPWDNAEHLVTRSGYPESDQPAGSRTLTHATRQLTAELVNDRDAASRWCAALLLARAPGGLPAAERTALARQIRREPCRENLRAYAALLAGADPLGV